ncbi:hypothetical protein GCM10027160_35090 [Streptomyces calidiresistens]
MPDAAGRREDRARTGAGDPPVRRPAPGPGAGAPFLRHAPAPGAGFPCSPTHRPATTCAAGGTCTDCAITLGSAAAGIAYDIRKGTTPGTVTTRAVSWITSAARASWAPATASIGATGWAVGLGTALIGAGLNISVTRSEPGRRALLVRGRRADHRPHPRPTPRHRRALPLLTGVPEPDPPGLRGLCPAGCAFPWCGREGCRTADRALRHRWLLFRRPDSARGEDSDYEWYVTEAPAGTPDAIAVVSV